MKVRQALRYGRKFRSHVHAWAGLLAGPQENLDTCLPQTVMQLILSSQASLVRKQFSRETTDELE
eukprot:CAMPEP_0115356806 /NCGR_PEP_ID=MMETSP0270-20121206/99807_1 /TAXON_ID=71861 /ORGANISM="Scrippsiella trochoidea, Strain CCMP3099" /LENGTH=64 /DNA_ID=CAMNT_0002779213 /DNA_START=29 /DNA_END=220 /DNA_ORIENTATION=+